MTPHEREDALDRLANGFMVAEIYRTDVWEVSANGGETHVVPAALIPQERTGVELLTALEDYVEGAVDTEDDEITPIAELRQGVWLARMSAPGYLDATEWAAFDTREEAEDYLIEMYYNE